LKPEIEAAISAFWDESLKHETLRSPVRMEAALAAAQKAVSTPPTLDTDPTTVPPN
jgi:hypothetical protein